MVADKKNALGAGGRFDGVGLNHHSFSVNVHLNYPISAPFNIGLLKFLEIFYHVH